MLIPDSISLGNFGFIIINVNIRILYAAQLYAKGFHIFCLALSENYKQLDDKGEYLTNDRTTFKYYHP